jgi:hypothetical protein
MTQADRVLSTPPTNTPTDPTRRHLLTIAAGGAVAAAIPTATLAAAPAVDPIFAAIDAHRQAHAASAAATAEIRRLVDLADQAVGRAIEIPSMIEPGTTVEASIWLDVENAIPFATYPEQHAHYLALLDQHREARIAITGDTDPIGEEEYAEEWDALGDFADTVPNTLAGLLAMLIYADEMLAKENDAFGEYHPNLIESLATAARTIGGQS